MTAGLSHPIEVRTFSSAEQALRRQDDLYGALSPLHGPSLLVWQSPRALIAGPTDARLPAFEAAQRACTTAGWPVVVRRGGGRICPVSPGTIQIAISRPVTAAVTVSRGYDEMATLIERLLAHLGLRGERGACPEAYCPGRYDIAASGRKIAGLAQAWRRLDGVMIATVGASLVVDESAIALAEAVNLFYRHDPGAPPCRREAIGSLRALAGRTVTMEEISLMLAEMIEETPPVMTSPAG